MMIFGNHKRWLRLALGLAWAPLAEPQIIRRPSPGVEASWGVLNFEDLADTPDTLAGYGINGPMGPQGEQGPQGVSSLSTDAEQIATLGTDGLVLVSASAIIAAVTAALDARLLPDPGSLDNGTLGQVIDGQWVPL